jgi:hypothetical protein
VVSGASPPARTRTATEADGEEMVELLLRVFHRWPAFEIPVTPLEHLRWKIRSDPIAVRHQWVTEIDDRIVAMLLRIICRVRVKGRDCIARDGVDGAVDPRYQGRRLYSAIMEHIWSSPQASDFDLVFSYSTNPRARRRGKIGDNEPIGNPVRVLQKPCRTRAIVARQREKYGGRLPAPLAVLKIELKKALHRLGHRPYWRRAKRAWSLNAPERFDDRIEEFFDEAAKPFDFVIVRTERYMNWRYCDPAAGNFTIRVAEQQGELLGYLVFKITEGEGYIADLLALPGRTDVVRSLIEDACRLFREAGVELVTCWMISRHPYNGVLRKYGFIDSERDVGFRYRARNLAESEFEFLGDAGARIHLTHGDSDWI